MLSADFIDWWFAPWRNATMPTSPAPNIKNPIGTTDDLVGLRDGYRDWCAQASISSELPQNFDPQWSDTALIPHEDLPRAAGLFMGLIAARQPFQTQQISLNKLAFEDRKWCLSLAATQHLPAYSVDHPDADDSLVTRGLAELALRLNAGFPGLWSRLQLRLQETHRCAVQLRIQNSWADRDTIAHSAKRSQRCWRLCMQRSQHRSEYFSEPFSQQRGEVDE